MSERTDRGDEGPIEPRVAAAMRGDRRALEALLGELLPRVRNLVRYLVRGDRDVDDIAQRSLMAVVRGLPSFRGDAPVARWADRITARETFRWLAHERAERKQQEDARDTPELYAVPAPDAPPDEYLMRREAVRVVDELPIDQRHAIVLHHVIGLSVPELAEELGVPAETARSRLRLGMKKLRAAVEEAK